MILTGTLKILFRGYTKHANEDGNIITSQTLLGADSISLPNKNYPFDVKTQVELNFKKQDLYYGTNLTGAEIKIEGVENVEKLSNNTLTIGSGTLSVTPEDDNINHFKIKITEETAPTGYKKYGDSIVLTVYYNKDDGRVTRVTSGNKTYIPDSSNKEIIFKNRPLIELNIRKIDFYTEEALSKSEIKISRNITSDYHNVSTINGQSDPITLKSTGTGIFLDSKSQNVNIVPSSNTSIYPTGIKVIDDIIKGKSLSRVTFIVEETKAPDGYEKLTLNSERKSMFVVEVIYKNDTGKIQLIRSNRYVDVDDEDHQTDGTGYIPDGTVEIYEDGKGYPLPLIVIKNKPKTLDIPIYKISNEIEKKDGYYDISSIDNRLTATFKIYKTDDSIRFLNGGDSESIEITTLSRGYSKGYANFEITPTVIPSSGEHVLSFEIEEVEVQDGYAKFPGKVKVTVTYKVDESGDLAVTKVTSSKPEYLVFDKAKVATGGTSDYYLIKNEKLPNLIINKVDFDNTSTRLPNAKFKIVSTENVNKIQSITTGNSNEVVSVSGEAVAKDGILKLNGIVPEDVTQPMKIEIEETQAPSSGTEDYYYGTIAGTFTITITRSGIGEYTANSTNTTYAPISVDQNNVTVTAKNEKLPNLIINKVDFDNTSTRLPNAKFKIVSTENVNKIQSITTGNSNKVVEVSGTNFEAVAKDGILKLNGIVPEDVTQPMKIEIEETQAPSSGTKDYYYGTIAGTFTITITRNGTGEYTATSTNTTYAPISVDQNNVTVTAKNKKLIDLGGKVWEDGQIGSKDVEKPNGIKNSGEKGLEGVLVQLIKSDGNVLTKNYLNERIDNIKTDTNGEYKFEQIPYLGTTNGYKVRFSYDGINWQETKSMGSTGTDSNANEVSRRIFNDGFKTISNGLSNSEKILTYELKNGTGENKDTAKLNVNMDGTNPGNGNNPDFRMNAITEMYCSTNYIIDCGLVKKEFDLSAETSALGNARIYINGIEKTEEYNSPDAEEVAHDNTIIFNNSDYKYRILDYITDEDAIKNRVYENDNQEYFNAGGSPGEELQGYLVFNVVFEAQTTISDSTVDEFVYYYDKDLTPLKFDSSMYSDDELKAFLKEDSNDQTRLVIDRNASVEDKTLKEGDSISGYKVHKVDEGILRFERVSGNEIKSPKYRTSLKLIFRVNKDGDRNIISKDFKNIVEITKYSTETGGLIDRDSAPGNADVRFNGQTPEIKQNEDDTCGDTANVYVKEEKTRVIKGTVFEDKNKDSMNNDSEPVNDVIVQLIEIKQISGKNYEYIWQETRSGSNTVYTTLSDGSGNISTYTVSNNIGEFQFKEFIPGNYIIRYIYGDGYVVDNDINPYNLNAEPAKKADVLTNLQKYNGQDYKSTIDSNYSEPYYNESNYEENASVARDNEARRLEVMAYSTTIDKNKGSEIDNMTLEALNNTWMAAETSRVNVGVGDIQSENSNIQFNHMNFGLALRPETKLVLEKHITGLKITPSGTGVAPIVDARITNVDGEEKITGITTGLATTKSTRDNRGFWQVATDVEELMQGAELEVEYTYVIKNVGEDDYLSEYLVEKFEGSNEDYLNTLMEQINYIKPKIKGRTYLYGDERFKGLGRYYYNGNTGGCSIVPTKVETFEEAINNQLSFDDTDTSSEFKIKETNTNEIIFNSNAVGNSEKINTVIENKNATDLLTNGNSNTRTVKLSTTLSSISGGELGTTIPSYIAEITKYSNAAGRRDMESSPENSLYVHSYDNEMTLNNSYIYKVNDTIYEKQDRDEMPASGEILKEHANEPDEFWAESIIITKPTGENKSYGVQIAIATIISLTVIGAGVFLIKKFALKK